MSECNHKTGPDIYVAKNPETCHQCRQLVSSGIASRLKSGTAVVARVLGKGE